MLLPAGAYCSVREEGFRSDNTADGHSWTGSSDEIGQGGNERRGIVQGHHSGKPRDTDLRGQVPIEDVDLVERFGVIRHEAERDDEETGHALAAEAVEHRLDRGFQPLLAADPALIRQVDARGLAGPLGEAPR